MPPTHSKFAYTDKVNELLHRICLLQSLQGQIETLREEDRDISEGFHRTNCSTNMRLNKLQRRLFKPTYTTQLHLDLLTNHVRSYLDFSLAATATKFQNIDIIIELMKLSKFHPSVNCRIRETLFVNEIEMKNMHRQCELIQRKITLLERIASPKCCIMVNRVFDCCINDYSLKRTDSRYRCISMPVITSKYGYKISFKLYPNGFGTGAGTYLSVAIAIMMGPFDALLPWPFSHAITIRLVNQLVVGDCIEARLEVSADHEVANQLLSERNQPRSEDHFIPISVLMNEANGFLVNDALIIQVSIDSDELPDAADLIDINNSCINIHPHVAQATD